jgi:hypothetical protein
MAIRTMSGVLLNVLLSVIVAGLFMVFRLLPWSNLFLLPEEHSSAFFPCMRPTLFVDELFLKFVKPLYQCGTYNIYWHAGYAADLAHPMG